jgi:integrase
MRQARRSRQTQPLRSALVAQMAAVIAILTFAPVRIGNLVRTRLAGNLIRYGGGDHPFWLVYPDYEVKNGVALEFPLDAETSAIVDEYIVQHRSVLLRGAGANWLFPGRAEGHKQPHQLSAQFTRTIFEHTGLRVTAHQVRHVSASLIIKHDPCNYELARQILGHKSERSTRAYYTMVDRIGSARRFNSIVRKRLRFDSDEGDA